MSGTKKFDHVTPQLKWLWWLPVKDKLKDYVAVMTYKCINELVPPYLCSKFKRRSTTHSCATRFNDTLPIPLFKSASGKNPLFTELYNYGTVLKMTLKQSVFEHFQALALIKMPKRGI